MPMYDTGVLITSTIGTECEGNTATGSVKFTAGAKVPSLMNAPALHCHASRVNMGSEVTVSKFTPSTS